MTREKTAAATIFSDTRDDKQYGVEPPGGGRQVHTSVIQIDDDDDRSSQTLGVGGGSKISKNEASHSRGGEPDEDLSPPFVWPKSPLVYQLNVPVFLCELGRRIQRKATLRDVPDKLLEYLRDRGFNVVYLLGVWQLGVEGVEIGRFYLHHECPDLSKDSLCGSPFAIYSYDVDQQYGGNEALRALRCRLLRYGLGLVVDYVPNHVACDHPWTEEVVDPMNPDDALILRGTEELHRERNIDYFHSKSGAWLAHGKDPYFDGWIDTAQLNYFNPRLHQVMSSVLLKIAEMADGVRCDMAMLILPQIFRKTWGKTYVETFQKEIPDVHNFWFDHISKVKSANQNFKFMAEVYWNMERELLDLGFDFCYDKSLYDHLKRADIPKIKHVLNEFAGDNRLVRFLENHDEQRVASWAPDPRQHLAAAAICYLSNGLKFFHMGQLEGRVYKMPMQRCRLPREEQLLAGNLPSIVHLYSSLFAILKRRCVSEGAFCPVSVTPSAPDSSAHHAILSFFRVPSSSSSSSSDPPLLVIVNYSRCDSVNGWIRFPREVADTMPGCTDKIESFLDSSPPQRLSTERRAVQKRLPSLTAMAANNRSVPPILSTTQASFSAFECFLHGINLSNEATAKGTIAIDASAGGLGSPRRSEEGLEDQESRTDDSGGVRPTADFIMREILRNDEIHSRNLGDAVSGKGIWFNLKAWQVCIYELSRI